MQLSTNIPAFPESHTWSCGRVVQTCGEGRVPYFDVLADFLVRVCVNRGTGAVSVILYENLIRLEFFQQHAAARFARTRALHADILNQVTYTATSAAIWAHVVVFRGCQVS